MNDDQAKISELQQKSHAAHERATYWGRISNMISLGWLAVMVNNVFNKKKVPGFGTIQEPLKTGDMLAVVGGLGTWGVEVHNRGAAAAYDNSLLIAQGSPGKKWKDVVAETKPDQQTVQTKL